MRYWHQQGRHQKLYNKLYDQLVPEEGEASTVEGEMLRTMSNVCYDVGNNGGCNLNDGRNSDLEAFIGYLLQCGFNRADKLKEQLVGLEHERPIRHCDSCDCQDNYDAAPPLDNNLFDEAMDLLVEEALRILKKKEEGGVDANFTTTRTT